jgi:cyclin H
MAFVRSSRITDAEFIYSPSQIALAAVYSSQPTLAQRWAESKGMDMQLMEKTAGRIVAMVATDGKVPELERVREVDRRLRTCKNPEKTAGTAAYEQRKAEEDSVATEKRVHKALVAQRSMEMDDPFGGNLGKNETKVESE